VTCSDFQRLLSRKKEKLIAVAAIARYCKAITFKQQVEEMTDFKQMCCLLLIIFAASTDARVSVLQATRLNPLQVLHS